MGGPRITPSTPVPVRAPMRAQIRAQIRGVGGPRWSPDGTRLGWVEESGAGVDLLVAPADGSGPPVSATGATPFAADRGDDTWAWVDARTLVHAEAGGRLVAVDTAGSGARVVVDRWRASAPAPSLAPSPGGSLVALVLESDDECEVAVVPLDGSRGPNPVSNAAFAWDPAWSPDGRLLAWHEWDGTAMSWDSSRIVVAAPDGSARRVVAGGREVAVGQPRFSPDGSRLAYVSDEAGWWNVWTCAAAGGDPRPVLREPYEHAQPTWAPGQRSFAWSPDGSRIALNRNEDGFARLVVVDVAAGRASTISNGWHHGLDWSRQGIVCVRSGARTPPAVTVLDPDTGARRVVVTSVSDEWGDTEAVEPEAVEWPGDDGAPVHGLLYRPAAGSFRGASPPLVVDVHGGPTGQAMVSWSPGRQLLVARGCAVLTPNHRGSTGYGRAYAQALQGRWGELDVTDTAAGVRAAAERGWADPARVGMLGGSAGAFTVLLTCARHPDLVRAAAVSYPVTDLLDLATTTHRLEAHYTDRLVGALPAAEPLYRERSPVTRAAAIRVPLLVLQGDADRVVRPAQARRLVETVCANGGHATLHVYPSEGHGWRQQTTVEDARRRTEEFLQEHVIGR